MIDEVLVVGLGSTLMGDDGVGVRVVQKLAAEGVPEGVRLLEGGLMGMNLVYELEESPAAIIVDAAQMNCPPGTIRCFSPDELADEGIDRLGAAHSIGLQEALTLAGLLGARPVETVEPREGLSETLEGVLVSVAETVLSEARSLLSRR